MSIIASTLKQILCCAICGCTGRLEQHHLGGIRHAPFFTLPLCVEHHARVTALIAQAGRQEGIDLMQESNSHLERARRARLAAMIFIWFVDEMVSHPAVVGRARAGKKN